MYAKQEQDGQRLQTARRAFRRRIRDLGGHAFAASATDFPVIDPIGIGSRSSNLRSADSGKRLAYQ